MPERTKARARNGSDRMEASARSGMKSIAPKAEKRDAATTVLQRKDYTGLSALLCSHVDVANRPVENG